MCALVETAVRLGFTQWTNSKALLVLTQHTISQMMASRECRNMYKENCASITFTFYCTEC